MGEDGTGDRSGRPVLGTLLDPVEDEQARTLSYALAADADAPVRFLSPLQGVESVSRRTAQATPTGQTVQFAGPDGGADAWGNSPAAQVATEVTTEGASVVVLQRPASESPGVGLRRATTDRIVANAPTDVVMANGSGDLDSLASILVPVAGGPHTDLAVRAGRALARHTDAWLELFHVVPEDADPATRDRAEKCLADAETGLQGFERYDTWCYEAPDPATAIAEQSRYYDAVVMGAPAKGRIRRLVFGSTVDAVDERVEVPIVTAVSAGP